MCNTGELRQFLWELIRPAVLQKYRDEKELEFLALSL